MVADKPSKAQRLQTLMDEFAAQLPQRIAEITEAFTGEPASDADPEGDLRRRVHNLAGAGGTFGFPDLGQAARQFELDIVGLAPGPMRLDLLRVHLGKLQFLATQKQVVDSEWVQQGPAIPWDPSREQIYVLEDDPLIAEEAAQQLAAFGYSVRCCPSQEALRSALREARPAALIADIVFPEGSLEGPRIAARLQAEFPDTPPIIYVSTRDDWEARLAAIQAGGKAYFSKPVDYPAMVEQLDLLTSRRVETPLRILLLDDEPMLGRYLACVLQGAGMDVETLTDPAALLPALQAFSPDLLLLDVYMPSCSGIDAAKVIRQNPLFTNLPIVFLSGEQSRDLQLEALREGGDDFLVKPIRESHLVAAVRFRARRFRALSLLMHRDSLTGLLNHIHLKLTLERELAIAQRRGAQLSVAMIDLDHFKQVNDTHGHPAGDRVIKSLSRLLLQRLRKGDLPARYGGEEFAVIFPDTSPERAATVLKELLETFRQIHHRTVDGDFTVNFSAGVAGSTPNASMDSLLRAADQALYAAKRAGRNRVSQDQG